MIKDFFRKNYILLILEMLIIITFVVFYGSYGDVFWDSFREAFIPSQMLKGNVLYKDIFCIYPPLSYFINSILFSVFGIKLGCLYCAGLVTTLGLFYYLYKISCMFLGKFLTFSILLLFYSAIVLSPNVFNPFFPYSYGLIYGLLFVAVSIYYMLNRKFPIAYFFYSLAICSKYEFIFLLPLLIFVSKKTDWKQNLIALFAPILFSFGVLFVQGVGVTDLYKALTLVKKISQAATLKFFYSVSGLTLSKQHFAFYIMSIIKFFIPIVKFLYEAVFVGIFTFILILFGLRYRKLTYKEKICIIAVLLVSIKVFWSLVLQSYGVYFLGFGLISVGILIPKKLRNILAVYFIIWSFIIGFNQSKTLINKNNIIKSEFGIVKTFKQESENFNSVIDFIKENSSKDDKVVVYPEGLVINFMTNKNGDNYFHSLIPLYVEVFGEEYIIKQLESSKPEYIVISNVDTSNYYFKMFGHDYAQDVYHWVQNNYNLVKMIDCLRGFWIFKQK